jgi:hypothetical protein
LCEPDGGSPSKRHRQVPRDEAEKWAKEEGLLFVEASAKSGKNVEFAFEQAARDILAKIRRGEFDNQRVCLFFVRIFGILVLMKVKRLLFSSLAVTWCQTF